MKVRLFFRYLLSVLIVVSSLWYLQRLLMPKYVDDIVEGSLIEEYYDEDKDHDVIFIGDCEVYENFSPVKLWEDYGINSYIRGSAQQLIWQSYYLLEDTLRYEKPKVVIFNVLSMKYNEPQNEAYNRMSIDGMRPSMSKIKNIEASMTDEEEIETYIFPILRYHSRWSELTSTDFKYALGGKPKISHNGYYMRVDVKPAENVPTGTPLADYNFGDTSYEYLDKITKLCKDNDIQLILIKAPSLYPYWYDEWEAQMDAYAEENDLMYINFLELVDEIGIDFTTDTYDAGLHMNLAGAEKLSGYLGKVLIEETAVTDRRGETKLDEAWAKKIDAYNEEIQMQYIKYGIEN